MAASNPRTAPSRRSPQAASSRLTAPGRRGVLLGLLTLLGLAPPLPALAADTVLAVELGRDYFGHDYRTLQDVDLETCKAACLDDPRCQALTFNVKAGWCFLKTAVGEERRFDGAISARRIAGALSAAQLANTRAAELSFLQPHRLAAARALRQRLQAAPSVSRSPAALRASADAAMAAKDPLTAVADYQALLRDAPADAALWQALASAALAAEPNDWQQRRQLEEDASAAAVNAYLESPTDAAGAAALALLGRTLAKEGDWTAAIRATRASLARVEQPEVRAAYATLVAEHGFRVASHQVDANAASPRICVRFSMPLPRHRTDLADFVRVLDRSDLAVEVEAQQICVDGVAHGERYRLLVRAGLPSAEGEVLAKSTELEIYVRDREPSVRFLGRAYVLPKGGEPSIPILSVNSRQIDATVYRIDDRALSEALRENILGQALDQWRTEQLVEQRGAQVWEGNIQVSSDGAAETLNQELTTAIPVAELVPELVPGIYALRARAHEALSEQNSQATQWFLVSDLGLATFSGQDGLHLVVRALSSAAPLARVSARLVAVNNSVLGAAVTDDRGYAKFAPGLLRGSGGNAPALLVATSADGDYGFLDLTQAPFDLSDRGVAGRAPPKALDVYLVSERGAYRPGESAHLTALVRDGRGRAVPDVPLTWVVQRPDGVESQRQLTQDSGAGGHQLDLALNRTAMRGTWRALVYSDPKGEALADLPFLVEDFTPERVDLRLQPGVSAIDPAAPPTIAVASDYLYGAPAGGLVVEGEVRVRPRQGLDTFPGYRFGLESETFEPLSGPLPAATTDTAGKASVPLELPEIPPTSKLLAAELSLRVLEGGARPVERRLELPLASKQARIGIKPMFSGAVDEGGEAAFEIIALAPDGQPLAVSGLRWTLSRVTTDFQWYQANGSWDYEPISRSERVADGTLDLNGEQPGRVAWPVDWGAYRLSVTGPAGGVPTASSTNSGTADAAPALADLETAPADAPSTTLALLPADMALTAGWYLAPSSQETPDLLRLSLDKADYRIGERARVHLEPRFAGRALVMVLDDRLIAMEALEVGAEGATLELPVTEEWGAGAYVAALLFRPMDLAARRMPARAVGLAWAAVAPGERALTVRLELPAAAGAAVRPRQRLEIPLRVSGAAATTPLYATLAVVDVGILNLTRHQPPAPDDWYFAQRRLGIEIRDLYGKLIDRMQGVRGLVRSGGDAVGLALEGPPPTEELVAFHSGILTLDAEGRARVPVALADFNGTLKVMAMVWSAEAVGHAATDLLVRDPIVVTPRLPRFLAPGDQASLELDLAHVEGAGGQVELRVSSLSPAVQIPAEAALQQLTLEPGARTTIKVPLAAASVGEGALEVLLRSPDGQYLRKGLRLGVRANGPRTLRSEARTLASGAELALDAKLLADRESGTGELSLAVGGLARLDVPGLLLALDRYPYGCTEQLTSRALPLLYLGEVARGLGLADDAGLQERVREAISGVLANQGSNGSFGLWGSGGADLWLDAYVTDFLTRARDAGHSVPQVPLQMAIDALRNQLAYAADFSSGGEGIAYALYVLARNGQTALGDLRYYADAKLDAFATPLAKAQLGAALALQGDRPRADRAFAAALAALSQTTDDSGWRDDYGSVRRDAAALVTLATETQTAPEVVAQVLTRFADAWPSIQDTSTQDQAWLLLAAHALMDAADSLPLTLDGAPQRGAVYRRWTAAELQPAAPILRNAGSQPLEAWLTVSGVPRVPEPAGGQGYRIERHYYDLQGKPLDVSRLAQGERLVAVLSVTASGTGRARLILEDPLPAGWQIDNPHLLDAGQVKDLPWLQLQDQAAYTAFLADRLVAALERGPQAGERFQIAYRLRAVSPGRFAHPAASVTDMYRPAQRAWTETGEVAVYGR